MERKGNINNKTKRRAKKIPKVLIYRILIIVVILAISGVIIFTNIKKNNEKVNDFLTSEEAQNDILTQVMEESINNLNLGKHGEYRLIVEQSSIVNMLTGDNLVNSSFIQNIEVMSNDPMELYIIGYSYNKEDRLLSIDIKGSFEDISTTRQTYKLSYKKNKVVFKKVETIILDPIVV